MWRSDALGELTLPKPEAETDGRDDGEFHRAHPRGGNIDLRQVCRDDMSVYRIPLKGLVYRTADHTAMSRFMALSFAVHTSRSRAKRSTFKTKLNIGLR